MKTKPEPLVLSGRDIPEVGWLIPRKLESGHSSLKIFSQA